MLWSPREYNCVADHAVNVTLDSQTSWSRMEELQIHTGACLRLCVTGGVRENGDAAVGLALYQSEPEGQYKMLARRGLFLGKLESAFVAEATALEWAFGWIMESLI